MNLILLTFSLASVLNSVVAAPAVSSVHVSFVTGNKATQYSHGTTGNGYLVQSNHLGNDKLGDVGDHTVRKRSITRRPLRDPGGARRYTLRGMTTDTTTSKTPYEPPVTDTITTTTITTPRTYHTTTTDTSITNTNANNNNNNNNYDGDKEGDSSTEASSTSIYRKMRTRVKFVGHSSSVNSKLNNNNKDKMGLDTPTFVPSSSLSRPQKITTTTSSSTTNSKDSKAVKRSPLLGENFVSGFNFPDFDEFGGNEFGTLRDFGSGRSRGGSRNSGLSHSGSGIGITTSGIGSHGAHTQLNPEALTPEGVFLPPLPTEASEYAENDPYLADPETAKYAAQHPPFFAAFPHKRNVLNLNERRVEQGLEPNILRSIRPFFPFFEIANTRGYNDGGFAGSFHSPLTLSVSHSSLPAAYTPASRASSAASYFLNSLDPSVLYYAESVLQPTVAPWGILTKKKK